MRAAATVAVFLVDGPIVVRRGTRPALAGGRVVPAIALARLLASGRAALRAARITVRAKSWTVDDGVVIFSTQGRFLSTQLARGDGDYADNVDVVSLLDEYARTGAAFQPYFEDPVGRYGLTLMSPEFLQGRLQRREDVIVRGFLEQAWGVQDVSILYRKRGFYEPLLA